MAAVAAVTAVAAVAKMAANFFPLRREKEKKGKEQTHS